MRNTSVLIQFMIREDRKWIKMFAILSITSITTARSTFLFLTRRCVEVYRGRNLDVPPSFVDYDQHTITDRDKHP